MNIPDDLVWQNVDIVAGSGGFTAWYKVYVQGKFCGWEQMQCRSEAEAIAWLRQRQAGYQAQDAWLAAGGSYG